MQDPDLSALIPNSRFEVNLNLMTYKTAILLCESVANSLAGNSVGFFPLFMSRLEATSLKTHLSLPLRECYRLMVRHYVVIEIKE